MDRTQKKEIHEEARREEEGIHIDRLVDAIIHPKTLAEELAEEAGYKKLPNFEGFLPDDFDGHVYVRDEQCTLRFLESPKIGETFKIYPIEANYSGKTALISGNDILLQDLCKTSQFTSLINVELSDSEHRSISLDAILKKEGFKELPDWPTFQLKEGASIVGVKALRHQLLDGNYESVGDDPYLASSGKYVVHVKGRMHVTAEILVEYNHHYLRVDLDESISVNERYPVKREDAQCAVYTNKKITGKEPTKLPPLEITIHLKKENEVTKSYKEKIQAAFEKLVLDRLIKDGIPNELRNNFDLKILSPTMTGPEAVIELGKQAKQYQGIEID